MTKFTEQEQRIGQITSVSGSLLLVDGALRSAFPMAKGDHVFLDVEREHVHIPVFSVLQGGKRFLILSLDDAVSIHESDRVSTENPVDLPDEGLGEPPVDRSGEFVPRVAIDDGVYVDDDYTD